MKRSILILMLTIAFPLAGWAEIDVPMGVYRVDPETRKTPLTRHDLTPDDIGFAGAVVGLEDNQTTGSFMGMNFELQAFAGSSSDVRKKVQADYEAGLRLFVLNAPEGILTALADQYGDALFLNAQAADNTLRNETCRANLLHIAPSYAMRTDALLQYLMWKKWPRIFLIYGSHEADAALAQSYRESANKFGADIVEEREYVDTGGARRADTGHVLVQKQIPVFTQDAPDHDVVVAADMSDVFATYLPYRIWTPRPVTGSGGLRILTWESSMEAWGGTQMQTRFEASAGRAMRELDYQNWLAVRVIGEAVIRTGSADAKTLREYMLSDQFEIAAFKGKALNFRAWNGQMRQPLLLSDARLVVSVSPQEGYLHQFSELDTLGYDQAESRCKRFQ